MATTQKVSPEQVVEVLAAHRGATSAELAEILGIGQSTAAKHLATLEVAGTARRDPGGREGGRRLADRGAPRRPPPTKPGLSARQTGSAAARWAPWCASTWPARPGEDLGPTQIGKALGRSQGAVSNALARLEAGGEAQLVTASPRRYRIVESR